MVEKKVLAKKVAFSSPVGEPLSPVTIRGGGGKAVGLAVVEGGSGSENVKPLARKDEKKPAIIRKMSQPTPLAKKPGVVGKGKQAVVPVVASTRRRDEKDNMQPRIADEEKTVPTRKIPSRRA